MLWEPLALAALNQPAREAAAPVFVRVLAQMLGPGPADSSIAMPLRPLTRMYAEPARAFIESHGGEVRVSSPARVRIEGRARRRRSKSAATGSRRAPSSSRCRGSRSRRRLSGTFGAIDGRPRGRPRRRRVADRHRQPLVRPGRAAGAVRRPAGPDVPVGVRQAPGLRRLGRAPVAACRAARPASWPSRTRRLAALARDELSAALPARPRGAACSEASSCASGARPSRWRPGQPPRPDARTPVEACCWPATGPKRVCLPR